MIKILFICHGNICRSPMAQYVMQDMVDKAGLADCFHIDSAATSTEEIGNGVHRGTRRKLGEVGIYCGDHRAVQLRRSDYEKYDYIFVMDHWNMRNMRLIFGPNRTKKLHLLLDFSKNPREIADPWYTGDFDKTYDDIVKGCKGL